MTSKAPPKLFEHVCKVFGEMRRLAKSQEVMGEHVLVYEGHTTKLFQQLGLPMPYYTAVLQRLQQMGCITQLSRGGGSAASRWSLLDDPTLEAFEDASPQKRQTRLMLVEKQVSAQSETITELMDRIEDLEGRSGFSADEMQRETRLAEGSG